MRSLASKLEPTKAGFESNGAQSHLILVAMLQIFPFVRISAESGLGLASRASTTNVTRPERSATSEPASTSGLVLLDSFVDVALVGVGRRPASTASVESSSSSSPARIFLLKKICRGRIYLCEVSQLRLTRDLTK